MKDPRRDPVAKASACAAPHPDRLRLDAPDPQLAPPAQKESRRDAGLSALAAGAAAALVAGFALSPAGLALALGLYGLVAGLALAAGPPAPFGTANRITLARAAGVAVLAGFALDPAPLAGLGGWAAAATGGGLLALDGIDGWIARRDGRVTAWGARLDMEVDALAMLVLCALLLALGKAGPWILAIGLMRYAFVALGWLWPRFARPLPPSQRRRAICAVQVGTLAALLAPPLAPPASAVLAALALGLLAWSFALDFAQLLRA